MLNLISIVCVGSDFYCLCWILFLLFLFSSSLSDSEDDDDWQEERRRMKEALTSKSTSNESLPPKPKVPRFVARFTLISK